MYKLNGKTDVKTAQSDWLPYMHKFRILTKRITKTCQIAAAKNI